MARCCRPASRRPTSCGRRGWKSASSTPVSRSRSTNNGLFSGRSKSGDRREPMHKAWMLTLLTAAIAPAAQAQEFRWTKGDTLAYRVKHDTTVTEVVDGAKRQFKSHLELHKRYRVMDVDADGIATLDYSLTEMRTEQTRPSGDVLRFDSTDPAKSTPELRDQLGKYVGSTLAVLRIDRTGNVVAVKKGPARHLTEPPFK